MSNMTIYVGQKHTIICNFSYLCEVTWHLGETQYLLLITLEKQKGQLDLIALETNEGLLWMIYG